MNANDLLLSKAAVMERLGVSDKTLRRLVKQGRLSAVKLGKTSPLKFRQIDLARFLETSLVTALPPSYDASARELAR
jgi:excisionase family DNA binding protein